MGDKCKDCRWVEIYEDCQICGYIAEVYHIKAKIKLRQNCLINKRTKEESDAIPREQ